MYDIIEASPSHATLKLAIDTTGLTGTLKGPGPFPYLHQQMLHLMHYLLEQ